MRLQARLATGGQIFDLHLLEIDVERHLFVAAIDLVGEDAAHLVEKGAVRSREARQHAVIR